MFVTFKFLNDSKLGNAMFQIAATISIAKDNSLDVYFPYWKYSNFFEYPISQRNTNALITNSDYDGESHFHHKLVTLNNQINWNLIGYYQSEKYFIEYREEILKSFQLKKEHLEYINKQFPFLLNKKTCSIHVRRGDYLNFPNHHPVLSLDYYKKSIGFIANKENIDKFVVCSDDIEWCKQNLSQLSDKMFFIEEQNEVFDMIIMSLCDHNIIANSSFSWWSGWLNKNENKIVIAPNNWFGVAYDKLKTEDLIPESWIKL